MLPSKHIIKSYKSIINTIYSLKGKMAKEWAGISKQHARLATSSSKDDALQR